MPCASLAIAGCDLYIAGTTLATAISVGFSALAAQASVALVNTCGDLGKMLKELGSTNGVATKQAANQLASNVLKNVTNNTAGAMINSAITGRRRCVPIEFPVVARLPHRQHVFRTTCPHTG